MNHPVRTQWQLYAADLLAEAEREQLEHHLAMCESCLLDYMEVLEKIDDPAVQLHEDRALALTDEVMAAIAGLGIGAVGKETPAQVITGIETSASAGEAGDDLVRRKQRSAAEAGRRRLLHYVIAVCFMLLMMSAGVFDRLADGPAHWEKERVEKPRESLTESIMARTSVVINSLVEKPRTDQ
ncbi:hypothetical protein FHS18_002573 [Paenibacillus phyllosphaerae]|uniref:Anti-sigma-W factor RsiW n=1 Tax=Paenibacillus phyllosphaerae TaxID=274593 RepID=A0A7W5AY89_9BACL|nr:zf-HC2 domain-containing protein [Paenibacillus phyllosphaerae]MBB3110506.1 hypothetical protein [Paenibacillus phyllosphaerae]